MLRKLIIVDKKFKIVRYLDPKKEIFSAVLFRESCIWSDNVNIKDLDILGKDLRNIVLVDNSPISFW